MAHILVVGGTGMLCDVCRYLCESVNTVTVIARNKERLNRLVSDTKKMVGSINPLSLDYAAYKQLKDELRESIFTNGPVELTICWINTSKAPEAATIIADIIDKQNNQTKCKYYQLLSSATADPLHAKIDISKNFNSFDNIDFRTILLGFVTEGETSRWLTDKEICSGVIEAIENNARNSIIGTVEPWNRRP